MSDTIDAALEALAHTGPEFGGGLANHGPMGAEALVTLGRLEAVMPWVEHYGQRRQLEPHPEGSGSIPEDGWMDALGEMSRFADWVDFFEGELSAAEHLAVLKRWIPQLASGLVAASCHGLIRTAQAVRSLDRSRTPRRLHELAEGLGYWAARYQTLPGTPSTSRGMEPSQAVGRVELLPASQRPPHGLISDRLQRLEGFGPFAEAINLIGVSGDVMTALSDLTQTFARLYLMHADRAAIAFIHALTAPSSLRLLAPHLDGQTVRAGLQYAWQAAAAIYAAYGEPSDGGSGDGASLATEGGIEDLIDRAIASGDEHAIKFTEALLPVAAQVEPAPVRRLFPEDGLAVLHRQVRGLLHLQQTQMDRGVAGRASVTHEDLHGVGRHLARQRAQACSQVLGGTGPRLHQRLGPGEGEPVLAP